MSDSSDLGDSRDSSDLLRAIAEASHATRVERMLDAIASAFASTGRLRHVELVRDDRPLSAGTQTRPRRQPDTRIPVDDEAELRAWWSGDEPAWTREGASLNTIGRLVSYGLRSQSITRKVADASRRAHAAKRELERQVAASPGLVARSAAMRELLARARAVAPYPTSVLITGPSGSGKEVVARFLHANSGRGRSSFISINCGALPESLAESELFGHEVGAFTGASRRHRGVFERAHRGTLFLDEVGELPPSLQVKLLRTLQERELTRVGGEATIRVDVRVVAATNRPLREMVAEGRFREDLFFRLSVFPLCVPPLAARQEDVPALVEDLLAELSRRLGRPPPALDEGAMSWLQRQPWPGNVRELANVLEAAWIAGDGDRLRLPGDSRGPSTRDEVDRIPRFDDAIRQLLRRALAASRGKIYGPGGAAEMLDLNPGTLQSKLRKYGITRRDFLE